MALHEWTVGGGLVESDEGLLLVRNRRRGGHEDWSPPGGVIDATDPSLLAGLSREVAEETGIDVSEWSGPLYEVTALAPDLGWRMRCEVHVAASYRGRVRVDDPDGIVVEAAFVPRRDVEARLAACPPWVREPLAAWLTERWGPGAFRSYDYEVHGVERASLRIVRTT